MAVNRIDVLESVVDFVGGQSGILGLSNIATESAEAFHTVGIDESIVRRWNDEFGMEDPWADRVSALEEGDVVRGFDLHTFEELHTRRVYREIALPMGARDVLASIVAKSDLRVGWVNAYDRSKVDGFDRQSVEAMVELTPHLQRATRIHARFAELRSGQEAGMAALDALTFGIIACDAGGAIVTANRMAEKILSAGKPLRVKQSRLICSDFRQTEHLSLLLRQTAETANQRGTAGGGALVLERGETESALTALVVPLSRRREQGLNFAPNHMAVSLIVLTDPEQNVSAPRGLLRELYGLTDVESQVALVIANGGTVEEYARKFGIERNTARGYLKRVLAKTQTRKQSRLVAALLRVLAPIR